jgi:hypothetical protein
MAQVGTDATAPVKMTVVPRRRGDGGVVKGMIAAQPVVKAVKQKAHTERKIRTAADLPANLPVDLVRTVEIAWRESMPVIEGYRLNDAEARILIGGVVGQVSLVWDADGRSGVFVRSLSSSVTHRCDSGPQAIAFASGDEDWPWSN